MANNRAVGHSNWGSMDGVYNWSSVNSVDNWSSVNGVDNWSSVDRVNNWSSVDSVDYWGNFNHWGSMVDNRAAVGYSYFGVSYHWDSVHGHHWGDDSGSSYGQQGREYGLE